jgi:hypothetical protein
MSMDVWNEQTFQTMLQVVNNFSFIPKQRVMTQAESDFYHSMMSCIKARVAVMELLYKLGMDDAKNESGDKPEADETEGT